MLPEQPVEEWMSRGLREPARRTATSYSEPGSAMRKGHGPGDMLFFQAWYRDVGNTNNFTDAVSVTFQ